MEHQVSITNLSTSNFKMKKTILYVIISVGIGITLVFTTFLLIVLYPAGRFADSYMSTLRTKYRMIRDTNSPKIIIVTGSSGAFSMDNSLLASETGYAVTSVALHAGMGALYETELTKANMNAGDIVLVGYEWGWASDKDYFDQFGTDLIMTGIDDEVEMYKYVPISKYKDIIGNLPCYAYEKMKYEGGDQGPYSRAAFDKNGNMTIRRTEGNVKNIVIDHYIDVTNAEISASNVKYLKKYKKYVEDKGARIYWIGCPTWKGAVSCDADAWNKLATQEEKKIGIEYISDQVSYIFPDKYMYDTIYHCNTEGQEYRTKLLIDDLRRAQIIK